MIQNILRNLPGVTKNLLLICGVVGAAQLLFKFKGIELGEIGGLHGGFSSHFEPFQIVTHMFMHGSLMHFFFNMFALVMFGALLERVWGAKRFLIFYFACGLGAAALSMGVDHFQFSQLVADMSESELVNLGKKMDQLYAEGQVFAAGKLAQINLLWVKFTIGASGAIYGLLVAFAMLFPNQELQLLFIPIPIKAKYFVPGLIAIEFFLGMQNYSWDIMAHWAHLGGAAIGFVMVKIWQRNRNTFY